MTPSGEIVAIAAERVGDRYKHSWDSRLAYDYLRSRSEYSPCFGGRYDYFIDAAYGLERADHHLYHAASTFFTSGFENSAILVVEGQGPREGHVASTSVWLGNGKEILFVEELFPDDGVFAPRSIGHFYTAIGCLAGMRGLYGEGKTMALAAYGRRSPFLSWLRTYVHTNDDGTYHIDPKFTLAVLGNTLGPAYYEWSPQPPEIQRVWDTAIEFRGRPIRDEQHDFTQEDMNVAFAGQLLIEEIFLGLARRVHGLTGSRNLCLAGGVALNCVANGRLVREGPFDRVFIPPAPSDEGQSLGKLLLDINKLDIEVGTAARTAYLGPEYSDSEMEDSLRSQGSAVQYARLSEDLLLEAVVSRLDHGQVVATCYGRSEFGPRALGHRSILADPRPSWMRHHINAMIKDREWYRPLAPMVMEECAGDFFDLTYPSPFMARAVPVLASKRSRIPAVVHVDGTARVQTVNRSQEERCYRLLRLFQNRTGIPVILNTSFNRRGEPIVETPTDALTAFQAMNLDALMLGDYLVTKT